MTCSGRLEWVVEYVFGATSNDAVVTHALETIR